MMSYVLFVCVIATLTLVIHSCDNITEWPHNAFLDSNNKVFAKWVYNEENITIEVTGETKGWVGIGFSPNGGMAGADIALGWVQNGKGFLQDRHGPLNDNGFPPLDKIQNVNLLSSSENETHTTLCYQRKLNTCDDDEDLPITNGTMTVIWAMNPNDPSDPSKPETHGPKNRGQLIQNVLGKIYEAPTEDVKIWEIKLNNVPIPDNQSTLYWCRVFRVPNVTEKQHLVGYRTLVQKENDDMVHHFGVAECVGENIRQLIENISDLNKGFPCFGEDSPPAFFQCQKMLVTMAVKGLFYPPDVGLPFAFYDNKPAYYLINAHYNIDMLRKGRIDSSGVRFYYTNNLRKNEASLVTIGYTLHQPFQIIPPGQKQWRAIGQCSQECLKKTFDKGKIYMFGAHLHAHKTAHQIIMRHFRDNIELPPVISNDQFHFNNQEAVLFSPVEILPNDVVTVECTYDTSKKKKNMLGGITTADEMCTAFVLYYPRMSLNRCFSNVLPEFIENVTGVQELKPVQKPGDELVIQYPTSLQNMTLRDYLHNLTLSESQIKDIQNVEFEGEKAVICSTDNGQIKGKYIKYPQNFVPYVQKDFCAQNASK